jgi:TrmH family RNA methyltransferase
VVFEAPERDGKGVLAGEGPAVVLDRIQDPGNLGTIARTAEGAGACGLFLAPGCADPGSPKALRASAGALLRLPSVRVPDPLALLRQAGRPLFATAGQGGIAYDRAPLAGAFALLLGQEGGGLDPRWRDEADLLLTVPMAGRLESLNVAATAAAILFEAARQRRCAEAPLQEVRGGPEAP